MAQARNNTLSKSKTATRGKLAERIDWSGVATQRVQYEPAVTIFSQGDPATTTMYVDQGTVRLSVLSHTGKEAVVGLVDAGYFFGEGCLAGQSQRMSTATAMTACAIVTVDREEMVRHLHANAGFADRFLTHMLIRNIRV